MKFSELSKWDMRFLGLAAQIATWSKGPRKFVGAVIAHNETHRVLGMGYNGPPAGFDDEAFTRMSREEQHKHVIHAEENALKQFWETCSPGMTGLPQREVTMYVTPLRPCYECAICIESYGIKRVVAYQGPISRDWEESAKKAEEIFHKNGVEFVKVFD